MKTKLLLILLVLLSTSNIQAQWIRQYSGVNVGLTDVYCITEDIVIVVGGMGTILKTTDGGENWIQKNSNTSQHLNKVKFANSTIGYTIGENGTLLKTIDTGENWTIIDTNETVELYGLSCVNENVVYISGENGLIKRTDDGGANWITQSTELSENITNIQFLDEQIGYATAEGIYIIKTINAGVNWINIYNNGAYSLFFLNEDLGYLGSSMLLKTDDGGASFIDTWYSCFANVFSLFSTQPDTVWTAGFDLMADYGCIGKGKTVGTGYDDWTWTYTGGYYEFYKSIHFANNTVGYVVGYDFDNGIGVIIKNNGGNNTGLNDDDLIAQQSATTQPNPVLDILNISFNKNLPKEIVISIFNTTGNKIYKKDFVNKKSISLNLSFLSAGIYFLKIQSEGQILTKKIIKL